MKKSGNVENEKEAKAPEPPRFQVGDVVAITQAALRMGRLAGMSPRILYRVGQPNEFLVIETFETAVDGPCIRLMECCGRGMVDRDKNNKRRCNDGHPALFFEKVDVMRMPQKGDKASSVFLPFLGEVAKFEWHEDENTPAFVANLGGKKIALTGFFAKLLKTAVEGKVI